VLDSGCTNHMIGEKEMFTSFEKKDCPSDTIMFGDNSQGKVLVEPLDYNLLFVSQLCEMGYNYLFTNKGVTIFRRSDGSYVFSGILRGKLYLVDSIPEEMELDKCLIAKTNMGCLWYRRLAHVGMRNLHKLQREGHILGLMNVAFEKDRPCGACQVGKQVEAPHQAKNIMTTTRPLEMLHMDLFGPIAYKSINGNKYGLVIADDYSRFTWVFFLQNKGETQEVLKKFLKRAQNEFDAKVKKIRSDNGTEFKNTQVEDYLDKEGINKASNMSFRPPTLHNKMGWPKGRIGLSLIWKEPCLMSTRLPVGFGRRWSIWCVMTQTVYIFTSFSRRHLMSSLPVTSQMSLTLDSLKASAMFFKRGQSLLNLLLKFMKGS
jgi:hypothetical protein